MSSEIRRFGGTVLRIIGDEVLAVFGAPVAHEDDAERAVRAALARLPGDPALLVQVAAPLLALDAHDALLAEVQADVDRILAAAPDDGVKQTFLAAEPIQPLVRSGSF